MVARATSALLAALAAGLLAGCASQSGALVPPSATLSETGSTQPPARPVGETVNSLPPAGPSYQLTAAELDLSCKQLTGRTAVRIVQLRDYTNRAKTTALSRTIQGTTTTMLGGSMHGADPDGTYAHDRSMLAAYNSRLVEKKCPSFNLDAELDPNATEPPSVHMPGKT